MSPPKFPHLNEAEPTLLIGNPPSWMTRYGIGAVAGCFSLLLALGHFVRYPDVVEVPIVLTTARPPIRVLAPVSGPVAELLATDGQPVIVGQVLAVLESAANWRDVLRLEAWLNQPADTLLGTLQLGALQPDYSAFSQHWRDYRYFSTNPNSALRAAALAAQISQLEEINGNLARQKALAETELALSGKERNRQRQLYEAKVVAEADWEKVEAKWLQQQRQIELAGAAILQNDLQIRQLRQQTGELRMTKSEAQHDRALTLTEDAQRLRSAIAQWKRQYLITAPIAGQVSLANIRSARQSVAAGDEVLAVVPDTLVGENRRMLGRAVISPADAGKIKPGSRAILRLDAWSAAQYGAVEGMVTNLAAVPQPEGYAVEIDLPAGLRTTYGRELPFRQEMTARARLIAEERRVTERIFDRLYELVKH